MRLYDQNIWGNTAEPIGNRNVLVKELIEEFQPDVCCFQECSPTTSRVGDGGIQEIIKPKYIEAVPEHSGENYTPIFYAPDKVEAIDGGFFPYDGLNDKNSKSLTWTLFREIATGKKVIIMSTHFWWKAESEEDDIQRVKNAEALVSHAETLHKKYGVPVIVSGDFNSGDSSQGPVGYNAVLKLGMTDVRDIAEESDRSRTCSHNMPKINPESGKYEIGAERTCTIDYIFSFKNELFTANRFCVVTSEKALCSSDHSPLIFDFEIL